MVLYKSINSKGVGLGITKQEMQDKFVLHLENRLPIGSEWRFYRNFHGKRPDLVPTSDNLSNAKIRIVFRESKGMLK